MSEICKNLWAKLDEYKRYIDFLKEENLESTFKDCKTEQEFKDKLEIIKFEINRSLTDFNNAKLVDVKEQRVFWKDAVIIEKLSGAVAFGVNDNHRISSITSIIGSPKVKQDIIIDEISKLEGLEELDLSYLDLSGIDLSKLKNLKNLKRLIVSCCTLTQTQIEEISTLEGLEELDLWGNDLSKIDLSKLKNLKNLKRLHVNNCNLTQAQIDEISTLEGLEVLNLSNNNLSGINLSRLKELKKLKYLDLSCCDLTYVEEFIIRVRFALLGCEVKV